MWAVSALGGIGFTMAIFIAELGLGDPAAVREAKIAIIGASMASALVGAALLYWFLPTTGRAAWSGAHSESGEE
jgi:Na+/H+ antiporter NhaA